MMNRLDNPTGHYEDMSFVDFHEMILRENGLSYLVSETSHLSVNDGHAEQAKQLLQSRDSWKQWGWKDPRTSLFLSFWKSLIPELKVLVVYRHYTLVTDSLFRRDVLLWKRIHPILKYSFPRLAASVRYSLLNTTRSQTYLGAWNRYNCEILQFMNEYPDDSLVVRVDDVIQHPNRLIELITSRWSFELASVDTGQVYESGLLHQQSPAVKRALSKRIAPNCESTYQLLEQWRARTFAPEHI